MSQAKMLKIRSYLVSWGTVQEKILKVIFEKVGKPASLPNIFLKDFLYNPTLCKSFSNHDLLFVKEYNVKQ